MEINNSIRGRFHSFMSMDATSNGIVQYRYAWSCSHNELLNLWWPFMDKTKRLSIFDSYGVTVAPGKFTYPFAQCTITLRPGAHYYELEQHLPNTYIWK